MNHATAICRYGKVTEKSKAKPVVQAARRVRQMAKKDKGCRGNQQGQTKVPAPCDVANAFLRTRFLPRLQETELVQYCDKIKLEREFYKSLSIITEKYGISLQDSKAIPFPYNISTSLNELREILKKTTQDWREIRLIHHNNCTFFASEERFNTGMTLYYVPVLPLHTILADTDTLQAGLLLLSVYAYLYQVLSIPYYRSEDCYLSSIYETLEMWNLDERDDDTLDELQYAKGIGDTMKTKICDTENLHSFEKRLKGFKPNTDFDRETHKVAKQFFGLFKKYPKTRLDRKYFPLRLREEMEDGDNSVTFDNYVSFCASFKGDLFESLCQFVNEDLQECCEVDEPTCFLPFDGRTIKGNNFDFERQIFDRLDDLIALWQNSNF